MKKRNRSTSEREFQQEVNVWKNFNERSDDLRICPLICTFELEQSLQSRYYLIFPLATGSLPALWACYANPGEHRHLTARWMAQELSQLATTLSLVHNEDGEETADSESPVFGRFGDIKPANLLWFAHHVGCQDAGSLMFTDFGLAKSHRKKTMSQSFPAKTRHSETYKAPEFAYLDGPHGIGRKADIWSFGCTLIEHLTWWILGNEMTTIGSQLHRTIQDMYRLPTGSAQLFESKPPLDLFADRREEPDLDQPSYTQDRFFSMDKNKQNVFLRPSVVTWIKLLHEHEKSTKFTHELLCFIQAKMLHMDYTKRASANDVKAMMEKLLQKLSSSRTYGTARFSCTADCLQIPPGNKMPLPYKTKGTKGR